MNRRGFLSGMIAVGAACMALPSAVTYARQWKRTSSLLVPDTRVFVGWDIGAASGDADVGSLFLNADAVLHVFNGKHWSRL